MKMRVYNQKSLLAAKLQAVEQVRATCPTCKRSRIMSLDKACQIFEHGYCEGCERDRQKRFNEAIGRIEWGPDDSKTVKK